ncbi:LacI family DNA-binding transcriptional regulator [Alteromonas sp. C1M14]|uniref:LacI family DNA-binding transcriptional regulator n=1 Tax=Alteromonas sp. C1M14 TaxID=2841567 RepID=UPI001C097979|nr:LacI family DNA-binding transcriptional regulator [Alteromonas sp. C1M14]
MTTSKLTIKEVASRLNVSTATISNAFNRPDQLSAKKREAILKACEEMGYMGPNKAARSLRRGKSNIVALVLPDSLDYMVSDPVASQFIRGVTQVLKNTPANLLLFSGNNDNVNDIVDFVDGFICYGAPRNPKLLNQLTKIKKTVVTADFNIPTAPSVNIDNTQAAYEVAKIALNATATKPVILGLRLIDSEITRSIGNTPLIDSEYSISHRRLDGYLKAIHEHGLKMSNTDIWHIPESTQNHAKSAVEQILSHTPLPDTLLCMSDVIALTAMQEALKRGLRVPDDIRIVGFDGIDEASRYHPTLTTVQQFNDKKGALAAQLYLTQEKENRLLPFELVEGNSTSH